VEYIFGLSAFTYQFLINIFHHFVVRVLTLIL
jgi:hypothetical protein